VRGEKLKIYQEGISQEAKRNFQEYLDKRNLKFLYILLDNSNNINQQQYQEIIIKFRQYFNNLS
jgi:hypothetical protein